MSFSSSAADKDPWQPRPPAIRAGIARFVQLAGLVDIVAVLLPPARLRLEALAEVIPMAGIVTARAATAAAGLLLIYLGAGLRRGKRRAWQVAVALAAASIALHVVKGLDLVGVILSMALLVMLIVTRGGFRAAADPRSLWRVLAVLVGFEAAGFVAGFLEIALRADRLVGDPSPRLWALHAALGLVGVSGPLRFPYPLGEAVTLTTGTFGLLAAGVAMVLLLRPGARIPMRTADDDQRLRDLLSRHGDADSLGYFALRRDKALVWSPTGKSVIAYRVVSGVSLAAGDPIGDPEAWPGAISAWLTDCARHGWTPAVLGCSRMAGRVYQRSGLDAIELGDEAIIDVPDFTLQGRPMRAVRQAVGRMERAGYRCEIARQADLPPATIALAAQAAARFRDGHVERGFSMSLSRIGDPADRPCVLVLCRDRDGGLRGMLQLVPWGPEGLSLDLMRGDRSADNGLIEFMVVSLLRAAPQLGVRRVSLNFAVLRSVFARAEELGAGPVLRMWHRILRFASRFWQIESLYRANAKYHPTWQPRYLCFPTARDMPRIALAALQAEAFLPAGRRGSRSPGQQTDTSPAAAIPAADNGVLANG